MSSKATDTLPETGERRVSDHSDETTGPDIEKLTSRKSNQSFVPPDGGLQAWLCVLGGFCCLFVSFGFLNACGIFQLYYEEDLLRDHNSSEISWIVTIALFLMYVGGPGFGLLADKKGPRIIIVPAGILIVFAICMLSLSTEYYQIMLSEGVAFGIGASALFLSPIVCVGRWFTTKRGLATGIVASGSGLGGVVFPIFIPRMIEQHGFSAAVRWTALLMGGMLIIAVFTVSAPYSEKDERKPPSSSTYWADFKHPSWWLFFGGSFLFMWGFFVPFNYLPLFASIRSGASQNMAYNMAAIFNAFSVVGRILPGYLGDKLGQFKILSSVAALSGLSTLIWWLPLQYSPSEAAVICFGAFYGFISGGFISMMTPCIVQLCRGKVGDLGKRLGMFMFVLALASLSGLPLAGAIKDNAAPDDFTGLIAFSGSVMLLGAGFITGSAVSLARAIAKKPS